MIQISWSYLLDAGLGKYILLQIECKLIVITKLELVLRPITCWELLYLNAHEHSHIMCTNLIAFQGSVHTRPTRLFCLLSIKDLSLEYFLNLKLPSFKRVIRSKNNCCIIVRHFSYVLWSLIITALTPEPSLLYLSSLSALGSYVFPPPHTPPTPHAPPTHLPRLHTSTPNTSRPPSPEPR